MSYKGLWSLRLPCIWPEGHHKPEASYAGSAYCDQVKGLQRCATAVKKQHALRVKSDFAAASACQHPAQLMPLQRPCCSPPRSL